MSALEARNLQQRYGQSHILKGVDLVIQTGETLAVIGPSGAGKSTLIRLLDLLETPSEGQIRVGDIAAETPARRLALRRRMSFVHQKPLVFTTTVFDNVAQPLRWRGLGHVEIRGKVIEALSMVDLDHAAHRQAKTLSGGETQRVALARALVTRPEILFLDEPTANLDPLSTKMVEELVSGIIRQQKLTVVMTTHDLAQGQRLADRIAVMMDGRILQLGTSSDIFLSPSCKSVAEFVGIENILNGRVVSADAGMMNIAVAGQQLQALGTFAPGQQVNLFVRPENITIAVSKERSSARNVVTGVINHLSLLGPIVRMKLDCGFPLMAVITRQSAEELGLKLGDQVNVSIKATAIHTVAASAEC